MAKALPTSDEFDCDGDEKDYSFSLLKRIQCMQKDTKACDVIIRVEGKEIPVHKVIIMASSDYFDAMFTHDTQESESGVVEIKGISYSIMKKVMNYIYSGKISLHENECHDLLYAANMFQLVPLCEKTASFLQSRLNPSSFFKVRAIAMKFSLEKLNGSCTEFALENLEELVQEEEFNKLELKFIVFLASSEDLIEDTKFSIILQWIKADVVNRNQHLLQLSNSMDLTKISPSFKKHILQNEEICYNSCEFTKALHMTDIADTVAKIPCILSKSKGSNSILLFSTSHKALYSYSPVSKSLFKIQRVENNIASERFTAAVIKENLYVLTRKKKSFRIKWRSKNSSWDAVNDMIHDHSGYLRAAGHERFLYVMGDKTFECFNEMEGNWKELSTGDAVAVESELLPYKHMIYCIGGWKQQVVADFKAYDPASESWSSLPSMRHARQTPSATVYKKCVIVAGGCHGRSSISEVESYDFTTNVWTSLSPMLKPHDDYLLCVVNNTIFAVGNDKGLQCFESYDFESNKWKMVEGLPKEEIMCQASVAVCLSVP